MSPDAPVAAAPSLPSSPRRALLEAGLVAALAWVLILLCLPWFNLRRIDVRGLSHTLNDQVTYISCARNLVDTGRLSCNFICVSTVGQDASKDYFHMPGHYLALAAAYALFGFGAFQSMLPSLIGYSLASAGVFLTGLKLYDRRTAFAGAALFMLFPANLLFAPTAMAEMAFLASGILAFCAYVHLPPRLRVPGGAALLLLPFLFRETGSLWVIPMAFLLLGAVPGAQPFERRSAIRALMLCVASVVLTLGVYASKWIGGRPSLFKQTVFGIRYPDLFTDATVLERLASGAGAWTVALASNTSRNLNDLVQLLQAPRMEAVCLFLLMAAVPTLLVLGWRRRDPIAFSSGLMGLTLLILLFSLYAVSYFNGLRHLLLLTPLAALIFGRRLAEFLAASPRPRILAALGIGAALTSLLVVFAVMREGPGRASQNETERVFMESAAPDRSRMLLSPFTVGLQYAFDHHPMKWGHLPANAATLDRVLKKYDVGTLLIPPNSTTLTPADLERAGFRLDSEPSFRGERVGVYKRANSP